MAKLAIKTPLGEGTVAWLITLSAVGTTLLMLQLLWALTQLPEREPSESRAWGAAHALLRDGGGGRRDITDPIPATVRPSLGSGLID